MRSDFSLKIWHLDKHETVGEFFGQTKSGIAIGRRFSAHGWRVSANQPIDFWTKSGTHHKGHQFLRHQCFFRVTVAPTRVFTVQLGEGLDAFRFFLNTVL